MDVQKYLQELKDKSRLSFAQLTGNLNQDLLASALTYQENRSVSEDSHFIGQDRARQALDFGLNMQAPGYNLFVMGEQATGRATLVKEFIEKVAATQKPPHDWVYVANFDNQREPKAIRLPTGEGSKLIKSLRKLMDEVLDTFPDTFENPGYQRKVMALEKQFAEYYEAALEKVENEAADVDVALFEEDGKVSFAPLVNGDPVNDEDFPQLAPEVQADFLHHIARLENILEEMLLEMPVWKRAAARRLRELRRSTVQVTIAPLIEQVSEQFAGHIAILKYLQAMQEPLVDAILELSDALADDNKKVADGFDKNDFLEQQFLPNLFVSHAFDEGAPIIYENNPTYQNMFGRIEYTTVQGALLVDYHMLSNGALHRANGGYLLLDADIMVEQPHVWEALKRALKHNEIRMDLPPKEAGMVNSMSISPAAIPLSTKVVLIGSRQLFYLLQDYDDEFDQLFRVLVDFDYDIQINEKHLCEFVLRCRQWAVKIGLHGITDEALTYLVLMSMRHAEHQEKLSARFADIIEILHEAKYHANLDGENTLAKTHLLAAISAKRHRSDRVSKSMLADIKEGQILIATEGQAVGKVNGLTVLEIGDTSFGTPARITSTVYAGSAGVVDIEREVELGQPIHSKGVMLLTGYLGYKYAQDFPLTLSANIALEQSYGHIDGDSASLGELIALISALTNIPCQQHLAITGSINQYGEVQPVGGINEKVEGFFDLCQQRQLSGQQGVIIPAANQVHLLLREDVIEAVKQGLFHIYTVHTVDEALTLLMQQPAGELNTKGRYPKGTINYQALNQLYQISNIVHGADAD